MYRDKQAENVSLAVVCFGDSLKNGEMTLEEFLDAAGAHGLAAVELCDRSIKDPGSAAEALRRSHLSMPSVALRNDFTVPADRLDGQIEHLVSWFPVLASFGARVARVWTGWQQDSESARKQVISAFDAIVPEAIEAGVTLAVETHGGMSNDPAFIEELACRFEPGSVGACIDFGNIPVAERRATIARLIPLAVHVHVKSYEFVDGVETTVPLAWAVAELAEGGYAGQWVLEYEGAPPYHAGIDHTFSVLERAGVVRYADSGL